MYNRTYLQVQRNAIHELRTNNNLHISVADKTSEFVVMSTEEHTKVTKIHFNNSKVYHKLDTPDDEKEVTKFITKLTATLEKKANSKWSEICKKYVRNMHISHHLELSFFSSVAVNLVINLVKFPSHQQSHQSVLITPH